MTSLRLVLRDPERFLHRAQTCGIPLVALFGLVPRQPRERLFHTAGASN